MNPAYPGVAWRANHRCEYCHAPEAMFNVEFEVEHIIPRSRGGSNDESNHALSCRACNLRKSDAIEDFDVATESQSPLFHPRQDSWNSHFRVDENGIIIGRSSVGRVTVSRLAMNSELQLAARQHWITLRLFP
jgi:HNH endonuclease